MGASCFWNIDRQGRHHTARSGKSLSPGCLWPHLPDHGVYHSALIAVSIRRRSRRPQEEIDQLSIRYHKTFPQWNYTITPHCKYP